MSPVVPAITPTIELPHRQAVDAAVVTTIISSEQNAIVDAV